MAINPNLFVEGYSVTGAMILNGSTSFATATSAFGDLYGVRTASVALNTSRYDNTGNNVILSSWNNADNATITVEAGYITFETLALLSGESITSSGSGPNDIYKIDPWTEDSINQSARPMLIRMQAKNRTKQLRDMYFGFYSVEFSPIKFTGPQYRNGLAVSYEGIAGFSEYDETGVLLPKKSVMTIVSGPAV
jgi:hypothetical protein